MVIVLCILLAIVTFLMGVAILLQEPKQSGLSGSFGMGGDQMLGTGKPNELSKFTGILAAAFILISMGVVLLDEGAKGRSVIEEQAGDEANVSPAPLTVPPPGGTGAGTAPPGSGG
jgi:preprotein translocase subunit SecG